MSLAAAAIQFCAVKALDGNIQAKVYDSNVDAEDLGQEPLPVVVVYCSSAKRSGQIGREIWGGHHVVDFVIDVGVAQKVVREVPGTSSPVVSVEFADNDSGHDLMIHTLQYEVERVLLGDNGVWAELWRRLFARLSPEDNSDWDRGASADKGVRLAILRSTYKIELANEPVPGAASAVWNDLFTAMEADSELHDIGTYWRALVSTPTLPEWRQVQAQLGMTIEEMTNGLAIGPLDPANTTGEIPVSTKITVLDEVGALEVVSSPAQETFTPTGDDAVDLKDTNPTEREIPVPIPEVLSHNDPFKQPYPLDFPSENGNQ